MRGTRSVLRIAALIASAALVVHELRYLLAPPAYESAAGHGYLPLAGLLAVLALALAFAHLISIAARARRTGRGADPGLPFIVAWLLSAAALVTVFVGQELLEGALAGERAAGIGAVAAAGGWVVVPLALAAGAVVALALAGARAVVSAAARRGGRLHARRSRPRARMRLPRGHRPEPLGLASHLAGRAPPAPS